MKKFYLLIALVVFSMGLRAQLTCPAVAFQYQFTTPTVHCVVNVGGLPTTGDVVISLVAANGQFIPYYGSTNQFEVAVSNAGTASFFYDCAGPGPKSVLVKRVVANTTVEQCTISNIIQAAPMPMKLTSFNGRLENETNVDLSWTSVIEFDSYQYQIERSADGKNYVKVGTINAAGASNEAKKYSFKDPLPGSGAYYYRLKQVDIDGKFEYSKSVYVNSKRGSSAVTKVFPNPFISEIQLIGATSADLNMPGNVKVFNMTGQMIKWRVTGANAIAIDESAPKGMYLIKIGESTHKLVKN